MSVGVEPFDSGRPAHIVTRFQAFMLDRVLTAVPFFVVLGYGLAESVGSYQVQGGDGTWRTVGNPGTAWNITMLATIFVLLFLYPACFIAVTGSTIGMRILGTNVVDVATGRRIGFARAFVRQALLCIFAPTALSAMSKRNRRRGWHDRLAGDLVVATR
jgi:uncharacterized RDD family membrane protein YckC